MIGSPDGIHARDYFGIRWNRVYFLFQTPEGKAEFQSLEVIGSDIGKI